MKPRLPILFLGCTLLLLAASAFAAPPEAVQESLFWELPDGLPLSGSLEVGVRVIRGGNEVLSETFVAEREKADGVQVVSLLASHPSERDTLIRLAARGESPIEVEVEVGGYGVTRLPLAELAARSQTLKEQPFRALDLRFPGAPAPGVEPPSTFSLKDLACENACDDEWFDCIQTTCYPEISCETCDVAHEDCLNACQDPVPVCPRYSVSYRTEYWLVGISVFYFANCFYDIWDPNPWVGEWYDQWQYTYEKRTYEVTTELCTNTSSEALVGLSYVYTFCNSPAYISCSYPFAYPYNVC